MKTQRKHTALWLGLVVLSVVVAFSAFRYILAGGDSPLNVFNGQTTVNQNVDQSGKNADLGAFISSGSDFTDVTVHNDLVVNGETTFTGTSTSSTLRKSSFDLPLTFYATSSFQGAQTGSLVVANYDNFTGDKWISNWFVDVPRASNVMQFSMACGTTTLKTAGSAWGLTNLNSYKATGTATILASSTISTTYKSGEGGWDTVGVYFNDASLSTGNKFGSYWPQINGVSAVATSSDRFLLKQGESFVCSGHYADATSTDSWGSNGLQHTQARFHADVMTRSN
jgi:hypothetical protein